jgi:hypothetical protein
VLIYIPNVKRVAATLSPIRSSKINPDCEIRRLGLPVSVLAFGVKIVRIETALRA